MYTVTVSWNALKVDRVLVLQGSCYSVCLTLSDHYFCPSCRHAQSLAALQAYSHWLAQYCSEAHRQNTQQFVALISTTMDAITPLISTKVLRQRMLYLFVLSLVLLSIKTKTVFLLRVIQLYFMFLKKFITFIYLFVCAWACTSTTACLWRSENT